MCIKELEPVKLLRQMCLQTHSHTHLNVTTKTPIPQRSAYSLMPPSPQVSSVVSEEYALR